MSEVNLEKKLSVKTAKNKMKFSNPFLFLKSGLQIIVVLCIIGLVYFIWQQQNLVDELVVRQNQILAENENMAGQLLSLQQDFEFLNNAEASAEILFSQQNSRVDSLNEEIVSLRLGLNANQGSGIWQIAEASSLLRLAQQHIDLTQDIAVALSLYQNSRAILSQIDDPILDRIDNLLASDVRNLSRALSVDTEGFYMRLSDISQQLDSVSLGTNIEPSSAFLERDVESEGANEAAGFFKNVREFLSQYFTVRRLDMPIDLPLSNQQISFLRQNMQIQIEQAKLALLQRRQAVYQDSISNVVMLAQQNIPEQDQQKIFILRSLRELQDETILLELPPLSESLVLLQNIMSDIPDASIN
jgi:uroporphyrin-III C-methyltransferase